jgi:hypothetical protein
MNSDQIGSEHAQSFLEMPDGKDKPRGLSLVKARVTNDKCIGLQVGRNIVPRGTHDVLLYGDEAKAAMALLVEDDVEGVKAAQRAYEMQIASEAGALLGWTGGLADLIKARDRGDNPEIAAKFEQARKMSAASPEAAFHAVNKRAIKPLSKFEIIEENIPEPQREKAVGEQNAMAQIIAAAVASALAANQAQVQSQIDAAVAKALAAQKGNGNR